MRRISAAALVLFSLHTAVAAEPTIADASLSEFKHLSGRWVVEVNNAPTDLEMTYRVGSNGFIVTERFGKELSVFYKDGNSLMMDHFCNVGNIPRLRLERTNASTEFEFNTIDVLNRAANINYVDRVKYSIVGSDRIQMKVTWRSGEVESYALIRRR
jgi:hypothetical protein